MCSTILMSCGLLVWMLIVITINKKGVLKERISNSEEVFNLFINKPVRIKLKDIHIFYLAGIHYTF